jgi:hypothetical protein
MRQEKRSGDVDVSEGSERAQMRKARVQAEDEAQEKTHQNCRVAASFNYDFFGVYAVETYLIMAKVPANFVT